MRDLELSSDWVTGTRYRPVFTVGSPYPPTGVVITSLLNPAIIGPAAAMAFLTSGKASDAS